MRKLLPVLKITKKSLTYLKTQHGQLVTVHIKINITIINYHRSVEHLDSLHLHSDVPVCIAAWSSFVQFLFQSRYPVCV